MKTKATNLNINQKINFKSWFNVENKDYWFMRINRVKYHFHRLDFGNRIDIPFTLELAWKFKHCSKSGCFRAKF